MVHGTDTSIHGDENTSDAIADPDTQPCLPPREASNNHGRRDHPSVDVEGIGDPEADKVPGAPLTAFLLDRFQIVVGELHKSSVQLGLVN